MKNCAPITGLLTSVDMPVQETRREVVTDPRKRKRHLQSEFRKAGRLRKTDKSTSPLSVSASAAAIARYMGALVLCPINAGEGKAGELSNAPRGEKVTLEPESIAQSPLLRWDYLKRRLQGIFVWLTKICNDVPWFWDSFLFACLLPRVP